MPRAWQELPECSAGAISVLVLWSYMRWVWKPCLSLELELFSLRTPLCPCNLLPQQRATGSARGYFCCKAWLEDWWLLLSSDVSVCQVLGVKSSAFRYPRAMNGIPASLPGEVRIINPGIQPQTPSQQGSVYTSL